MTNIEVQGHIDECRRMLEKIDETVINDIPTSKAIGSLIVAVDQLSVVVEDLANREQSKVIR